MSESSDPKQALTPEELQAWIGREHEFSGVDDVTRSDIRRKLEVYCADCPIHYDADVARAHGYRGIVAPVGLTALWAMPAYWTPGEPILFRPGVREQSGGIRTEIPITFQGGVNAAASWEYFEPLYIGDRLRGNWRLIEIKPHISRLGEGVMLTVEASIFKQTGELVAKNQNTHYRFTPKPKEAASDKPRAARPEPAKPSAPAIPTTEPGDWSRQLRIADVAIGDAVPPFSVWLSYQRIVMSVAADRMFSPLHHNKERAEWRGFSDIVFNTRGYEMMFETMLRRWIGLDGRVKKLGPFRMKGSSYPGDVVTVRARVTGKDERVVKLEIIADNDRGEAGRGEAEIALPP